MRRFALALLVAVLSFSVSDAASILVPEPCSSLEFSGSDSTCPPSCARCGCCHRAADVDALVAVVDVPMMATAHVVAPLPLPRDAATRDILHVPRAHVL